MIASKITLARCCRGAIVVALLLVAASLVEAKEPALASETRKQQLDDAMKFMVSKTRPEYPVAATAAYRSIGGRPY